MAGQQPADIPQKGLPPGCGMYYNLGPKPDDRYARLLCKEMADVLQEFLEVYSLAKDSNDAGHMNRANDKRSHVEIKKLELIEKKKLPFPENAKERIDSTLGKIVSAMEDFPPFPDPFSLIANDQALPNFINRMMNPAIRAQPRHSASQMQIVPVARSQHVPVGSLIEFSEAHGAAGAAAAAADAAGAAAADTRAESEISSVSQTRRVPQNSRAPTSVPVVEQPETPVNRNLNNLRREYEETVNKCKQLAQQMQTASQEALVKQMEGLTLDDPVKEVLASHSRHEATKEWVRSQHSIHSAPPAVSHHPTLHSVRPKTHVSRPPVPSYHEPKAQSVTSSQRKLREYHQYLSSLREPNGPGNRNPTGSYAAKATNNFPPPLQQQPPPQHPPLPTRPPQKPPALRTVDYYDDSSSFHGVGKSDAKGASSAARGADGPPVVVSLNPDDGNETVIGDNRDRNDPFRTGVGHDLLKLQTAQNANTFLIANRLEESQRFDGTKKVDFESVLHRFQLVTAQAGVHPLQKLTEAKHYFVGAAGDIVELYLGDGVPEVALAEMLEHLKDEYAYQARSAQQMLNEQLSGPQINKNDTQGLRKWRIALQGTYKKALRTNRAAKFDNADTINRLLRNRVPWAAPRWSVERNKKKISTPPGEWDPEPTFKEFTDFLQAQNNIKEELATVLGQETTTSKPKKNSGTKMSVDTFNVGDSSHSSRGQQSTRGGRGGGGRGGVQRGAGHQGRGGSTSNQKPPQSSTSNANNNGGRGGRGGGNANRGSRGRGGVQRGGGGRGGGSGGGGHTNQNATTASNPTPKSVQSSAPPKKPTGGSWVCVCCSGNTFHELYDCNSFKQKGHNEKFAVLKSIGACLKCMQKGHLAAKCTSSSSCGQCQGPHHTTMHRGDSGHTDGHDE